MSFKKSPIRSRADWMSWTNYHNDVGPFVIKHCTLEPPDCDVCFYNLLMHICDWFDRDLVLVLETRFFDYAQALYLRVYQIWKRCYTHCLYHKCADHELEWCEALRDFCRKFNSDYCGEDEETHLHDVYEKMFRTWEECMQREGADAKISHYLHPDDVY